MHTELVALEQRGWKALSNGTAVEFYDELLTEDACVVVPGMILTRAQTLESWQQVPPWVHYELTDERTLPLGDDAAILTYAGTARRSEGEPYSARFTSVYVRQDGRWKLAFHQQTPNPG
jgi:ketosteroid isomerase-like protein